jgi:hypothetical protein
LLTALCIYRLSRLAAPVLKSVELNAALRYDKYKNFSSSTPKFGAKWTPVKSFALRGTYSEGFRAPGPAEAGAASQSTGSSAVRDPVRCPDGKPAAGGAAPGGLPAEFFVSTTQQYRLSLRLCGARLSCGNSHCQSGIVHVCLYPPAALADGADHGGRRGAGVCAV